MAVVMVILNTLEKIPITIL